MIFYPLRGVLLSPAAVVFGFCMIRSAFLHSQTMFQEFPGRIFRMKACYEGIQFPPFPESSHRLPVDSSATCWGEGYRFQYTDLWNLPKLLVIEQVAVDLKRVPEYAYNPQVLYLSLTYNRIKTIDPIQQQFPNLRFLYVDQNKIKAIKSDVVWPHLEELLLNGNPLRRCEIDSAHFPQLKILDISGTRLKELPERLGEFKELRYLDVSGLPIQALPRSLENCRKLVSLFIRSTMITALPDSMNHHWPELRKLDIGALPLVDPQAELRKVLALKNLEALYLDGLPLGELPEALADMPALRILTCQTCNLKDVPERLLQKKGLERLLLVGNPISQSVKERIRQVNPNLKIEF